MKKNKLKKIFKLIIVVVIILLIIFSIIIYKKFLYGEKETNINKQQTVGTPQEEIESVIIEIEKLASNNNENEIHQNKTSYYDEGLVLNEKCVSASNVYYRVSSQDDDNAIAYVRYISFNGETTDFEIIVESGKYTNEVDLAEFENAESWTDAKQLSGLTFNTDIVSYDAFKFKQDYESLNGEKDSDGNEYITITIPEDNPIKYVNYSDVNNLFEEGKTKIVYIGFIDCGWCRAAIPSLLQALENKEIEEIYYLDKNSEENNSEEQNLEEKKLIELLNSDPYNINSKLERQDKIYSPTVLFIKDGELIDYQIGAYGYDGDKDKEITQKEYNKMVKIYEKKIKKIL